MSQFNGNSFIVNSEHVLSLQKTNEGIVLNPSFGDEYILIINNSKPQENRYLTNILKYLDFKILKKYIN